LYAKDFAGNVGASQNVDFTIKEVESFSILLVATVAVLVAVVAVAALVYWKKQRS
jgi:hypothetical protein